MPNDVNAFKEWWEAVLNKVDLIDFTKYIAYGFLAGRDSLREQLLEAEEVIAEYAKSPMGSKAREYNEKWKIK